jgi:HD-GYP domain-containing protein (c-di-GMP phosphodiesterase class II)
VALIDAARPPSAAGDEEADATRMMDDVAGTLESDAKSSGDRVTRPHPLVVEVARSFVASDGDPDERLSVVFASAGASAAPGAVDLHAHRFAGGSALRVRVGRPVRGEGEASHESRDRSSRPEADRALAAVIPDPPGRDDVRLARDRAFDLLEARARAESSARSLRRHRYELGELMQIARAMTTVRDVDQLLGVILEKCRFVTGADAGSIYIVLSNASSTSNEADASLCFKLTQNDSVRFDSREFVVPISERSIAGSVALGKRPLNIPDVYAHVLDPARDPDGAPTFQFDPSFDRRTGYITRSILAMPLVSQKGEVIGVIQLINKKRDPSRPLASKKDVDEQVIAFDGRSEELLGMVAAQAGASLETAMLYEEIRKLFEGFVGASVEAIESRDPTTSGHSRRVADLTTALARVVDRERTGPYAGVSFSADDLRELEYASVLHDFGKIGVREKVLVKAKKLYPERLELVRARFDYVARSIEADVLVRRMRVLEGGPAGRSPDGPEALAALATLDEQLASRLTALEAAWTSVCSANEPTVMTGGDFARIEGIARETFVDLRGQVRRLLDEEELGSLSVPRGSLTPGELDEIRSHVTHTFRFLSRIPWGKSLRRVPLIAAAHHERLDGRGYPGRLLADEIPVQSKMMSVADIYDALTASDRPYKKAMPVERALGVLDLNVKDGHLDAELVRLFIDARVWSGAGTL